MGRNVTQLSDQGGDGEMCEVCRNREATRGLMWLTRRATFGMRSGISMEEAMNVAEKEVEEIERLIENEGIIRWDFDALMEVTLIGMESGLTAKESLTQGVKMLELCFKKKQEMLDQLKTLEDDVAQYNFKELEEEDDDGLDKDKNS